MADFEMKKWLDKNVIEPLTHQEPKSHIYSWVWNGTPPKEILVWLLAGPPEKEADPSSPPSSDPPPFDPASWPKLIRRLLEEDGFRFDYLREQQMVEVAGSLIPIFGGDGAPLFAKDGMASARLFRKGEDGISLILQVGCSFPATEHLSPGLNAAAAVKAFFGLFGEENPLTVCAKYGAVFGQA